MSSKFATALVQFVPASFVIGAGMELFMLNTVSAESLMIKAICNLSQTCTFCAGAISCDRVTHSQLEGSEAADARVIVPSSNSYSTVPMRLRIVMRTSCNRGLLNRMDLDTSGVVLTLNVCIVEFKYSIAPRHAPHHACLHRVLQLLQLSATCPKLCRVAMSHDLCPTTASYQVCICLYIGLLLHIMIPMRTFALALA